MLLRHDVDNPYNIFDKRCIMRKINIYLNYISLKYDIFSSLLRVLDLTYLSHLWFLLDLESKYNARATFFFRTVTIPTRSIKRRLVLDGHEIAYHSDRNYSFSTFLDDLKLIERKVRVKIVGFTKHGYSCVRDGGPWIESKFISYGIKANLKYLAQGEGHSNWILPRKVNGKLWLFGHHITLKKSDITSILDYLQRQPLPMILVHPEDLFISDEETEKFEELLSRFRGVSIREVIDILNKLIEEDPNAKHALWCSNSSA